MIASTVTNRGQTTLPKEVRVALDISAGSKLIYEIKEDVAIIRKPRGILDSFAMLKRSRQGRKPDFKKARTEAREDWAKEAGEEGDSE